MSNSGDDAANGTPRSSHLSPVSTAISPSWKPPKAPLPPHRLAKLANALGVSTPVPANHSPSSFLSRSLSESASSAEPYLRSPTPSAAASVISFNTYPTTSKFLLHVIPPNDLPHDSNGKDSGLPPPNAPGYHKQFRRGTLVPVHSTLQAQLAAIAREYALPSTAGLILYLISTSPQSPSGTPSDDADEPGPRLSEDIWKHLWTRVLRTERDEMLMPSRSPTPHVPHTPHNLGYGLATRSTPFLPQENGRPLRPFLSSPGPEPFSPHTPHAPQPAYPTTTAPSTPSSMSDLRSNNKSAPPSSTSISHSEPGSPDTSVEDSGLRINIFDLPGLTSPSLIPILAKVEFDIDKGKAGWYEPWLRSRRANHAKRTEKNKQSSKSQEHDEDLGPRECAPLELLTGSKNVPSPFSSTPEEEEDIGYTPLADSPEESESDSDSGEDEGEDATAKVVSTAAGGKDPLADVFGSDADSWADIRGENIRASKDLKVVDLVLTGEELSALPGPGELEDDGYASTKEEEEVRELLEMMSKPGLGVSRSNSGKSIPPPLVLIPKDKSSVTVLSPALPTPLSQAADTMQLAYLGGDDEDVDGFDGYTRVRSPSESEKRGGAVFDDLDLGLDPTADFDDNDPNDRRRSQFIMKAQLDEIERTMAQLSPRFVPDELREELNLSFNSATLSPSTQANLTLSPGSIRSFDILPPSPRLPKHPDPPENHLDLTGQSWPAVPFSSIRAGPPASTDLNRPPSPPQLAVNGITTSAPKSYLTTRQVTTGPSESERRKEVEDELELYPSAPSPPSIIPLSPDPFGRFPSDASAEVPPVPIQGRARSSTTSRFSSDSITAEGPIIAPIKPGNKTTLMSVKSIKNLWRKSNNKTSSQISSTPVLPTPTLPSSGRTSPMVPPQRPERPSEEQMDLPDIPIPPTDFGRISPQPPLPPSFEPKVPPRRPSLDQQQYIPPSRSSLDQLGPSPPAMYQPPLSIPSYQGRNTSNTPIMTPHLQHNRHGSNLDRLHFDQESPYPIRRSPRPPSPPSLPPIPEQEKQATRKSILKWKPTSSSNSSGPSATTPSDPVSRTSFERSGSTQRGRRPSVINFGSSRTSVTSPDLPPSPQIPIQFVNTTKNNGGLDHRTSQRSRLTISSTESYSPPQRTPPLNAPSTSPPRSMTSSRDSQSSRPSFDASQFEFVSPKAGTLNYPYHDLDLQ